MTDPDDGPSLEDFLDGTRGLIDEYGWAMQVVAPRVGDDGTAWAYTVGLSLAEAALPELITIGLGFQVAHSALNELAQRQTDLGIALPINEPLYEVIADHPVLLREVNADLLRRAIG